MTKNKAVLVAVDAGSGNIALTFTDETSGKRVTSVIPALVLEGNQQSFASESSSTWLTTDAQGKERAYTVMKKGYDLYDTCDPDYQVSAAHRVLITDALFRAGLGGRDVIIGETLPVNQFYSAVGVINEKRIQQKTDSLKTPVANVNSSEPANIIHVEVFPEAVPAVVSAQSDNPDLAKAESTLVIDLGRFTCDIAVVDAELMPVKKASYEHGVQKMIERVHALLPQFEAKLGKSFGASDLSVDSIDAIIRQGYIGSRLESAKSKRIDITEVIDQAASELADKIWQDVRALHRNTRDIDVVLVVGGGANYIAGKLAGLTDHTADWHDVVVVPDNPEMAIVRGVHLAMMASEDEIRAEISASASVSDIRSRTSDKG
ncbi:plasmid segregation protein ParM domain-containing protein [Pantoea agglomerans]|uniref:plasmid segregation protein ParM domain-containing protein n=1 Tax=Enterobacter agglomerans TaxID=549 RepID=UPI003C7B8EC1